MKRILSAIFVLVLCLGGCANITNGDATEESPKQIIVFPTEQVASTINGYKVLPDENTENNSVEYIGNIGSKRFHLSDCRYAKNIKQENIIKSFNRDKMINDGFAPCQTCNP